jgi:L-lactate dehydrogenase complex protein LldG
MSATADGRKAVLERIRAATSIAGVGSAGRNSEATHGNAAEGDTEPDRGYVRQGKMTASDRLGLFVERLREYDADVVECAPEELESTITAVLAASGRKRFIAPPGMTGLLVEPAWKIEGFECAFDHELPAREVEQAEGVITMCFCGVADSGTIVLHHGPAEGRRVISLLPDWHLCVVRASQVVETLPEYFDRAAIEVQATGNRQQGTGLPALVTWISGPSATADIEMTRIKGVHGPRFLNVVLVKD